MNDKLTNKSCVLCCFMINNQQLRPSFGNVGFLCISPQDICQHQKTRVGLSCLGSQVWRYHCGGLAHRPVICLSALRSIPSPTSPRLGVTKHSMSPPSGQGRPIGGPDRNWWAEAWPHCLRLACNSSVSSTETSFLRVHEA